MGSFLRAPPLLLNSDLAGLKPQFPVAPQAFSGISGVASGFVPLVFPTCPAPHRFN